MKSNFVTIRAFGHSGIRAFGHSGIRAFGDKSALLAAWIAAAFLSFVPIEQSQAQLILTIQPYQGDTNNTTLWTFSGSSTADQLGGTILGAQSQSPIAYDNGGSDGALEPSAGDELFPASAPSRYSTAALYSLTVNPTNRPRITLGSETRTFSHLFLFNGTQGADAIGIRMPGTNSFSFNQGVASSWRGQGTLPYPISDFTIPTGTNFFYNGFDGPRWADDANSGIPANSTFRVFVYSSPAAFVPEPEQYAFVFALFALGFVIARRHRQKKRQASG